MITVAILINGNPLMARSATNTGRQTTGGRTIYKCDTGEEIEHHRYKGAVELAKKLLDTIKEDIAP